MSHPTPKDINEFQDDPFEILFIPTVDETFSAKHPEIDLPTSRLLEEFRHRIEAQGKVFNLRRFKEAWGYGTIIGRTEIAIVFLENETAHQPEIFYIFNREIRSISIAPMFHDVYLDRGLKVPAPPLLPGLLFTLEAKDDGYYLECKLPPVATKVTYGKDARQFFNLYPQLTAEAGRKRRQGGDKGGDGAFTSLDLRPNTSEPRP